jgi:tetratricopeptide (TPR) repeat protein
MLGLIFAALAVLAVVFLTRVVRACNYAAFVPYPVFINTLHPDLPINSYARGNLGVIQPTYGSTYLYVAYRDLAGPAVRPSEDAALWRGDERITGPQPVTPSETAESAHDWEQEWDSATGQAEPQESPSLRFSFNYQPGAGIYREVALHESNMVLYTQFLNCPQGAFHEALNTLQQRTQQYGESSGIVQNWIAAQQIVFGNCAALGTIPDDLPPTAPGIARADRAYQQAAAYFYAGEYDRAIAAFQTIAHDAFSPWSTIAPYLVARALVRKATVNGKWQPDLATFGQAERQIESVLADPHLVSYHHAADQLRGLIEIRLHPDQRLAELAIDMMRVPINPDLAQDMIDFRILFVRAAGDQSSPHVRLIDSNLYIKFAGARAKSPLLDWMLTLRLNSAEAYDHSLERWKATHSPAWLVAALTKADANSPELSDLLAAARQVSPASPAYVSVTFHTLRLLVLQGKNQEARDRLARLKIDHLSQFYATPPSTVNLLHALRFELAQNLDELFENAPRVPATITTLNSSQQLPAVDLPNAFSQYDMDSPRFDDDSLVVLNRFLPVSTLEKAVRSPKLPEKLRHQIALATWMRAALLGNSAVAHGLAPEVEAFNPDLTASVKAYDAATTTEARRFAAILTALRFPGLRPFITTEERTTPNNEIDDYRENWWDEGGPPCTYPRAPLGANYRDTKPPDPLSLWPPVNPVFQEIYPGGQVKPPAFLTAADRAEAARELRQLVDLGSAPDYLSKQAIAWAKAHPEDPRSPEALALAVKSTRFGCTDEQTGALSKAAFELLHRRYPKSSWANETKYWFKG